MISIDNAKHAIKLVDKLEKIEKGLKVLIDNQKNDIETLITIHSNPSVHIEIGNDTLQNLIDELVNISEQIENEIVNLGIEI